MLRRHVFDFTRLGVADRDFIVRAVHLLAEFVLDTSRAFDPLLMLDVLNVLAIFLRGIQYLLFARETLQLTVTQSDLKQAKLHSTLRIMSGSLLV